MARRMIIDIIPETPKETRVVRCRKRNGVIQDKFDVYIGRRINRGGWDLPASKWANPFSTAGGLSIEEVLAKYEAYLLSRPDLMAALPELKNKILACWCSPGPCHGDILVKYINKLE